ncbi:MAG: Hsp20/alpha crystallin family protein [Planctomycetota bacterium]
MAEKTIHEGKVPARTGSEQPVATREPMRYLTPAVDIYETNNGLCVVADMPGVSREDLNIQVEEGILTIQGRTSLSGRKLPTSEEYKLFNYFRQFELSDDVDHEHIQAELKNGVLTLSLPKSERAKPRRIDIQVSS